MGRVGKADYCLDAGVYPSKTDAMRAKEADCCT